MAMRPQRLVVGKPLARWLARAFEYPRYALLYTAAIVAAMVAAGMHHSGIALAILALTAVAQICAWILPWPQDLD